MDPCKGMTSRSLPLLVCWLYSFKTFWKKIVLRKSVAVEYRDASGEVYIKVEIGQSNVVCDVLCRSIVKAFAVHQLKIIGIFRDGLN